MSFPPAGEHATKKGGENIMEYAKPEIVACDDAVAVVQGTKDGALVDHINPNLPMQTAAAYDPDE